MYAGQNCSAARTLELIGERWSLLIIRDALFRGITRFADFKRELGLASNVLATRLDSFVAAGLMETHPYSDHPPLHEYRLTEKGRDLQPVILALTAWGDRWAAPHGAPIEFEHAGCGGMLGQHLRCTTCGEVETSAAITAGPGPGQRRARGKNASRLRASRSASR